MNRNKTTHSPPQDRALVTAEEWFARGRRVWYDPESARVLTQEQAAMAPGGLRVFERVAAPRHDGEPVWLTMLPGFPDGSYGRAQVDAMLGDGLRPRLYVEPVGQGDSDKPRRYHIAAAPAAGTWRRSPATPATRSRSMSAAATKTPTSTVRYPPPASACNRPRS